MTATIGPRPVVFARAPDPGLVSVVIPVFRDAAGLDDTLASLSRQTVDRSAYEIIVANDGGDPSVQAVCRRHAVTEVVIVPNRGSYFARNRALEHAAGAYIAFVDADITVPAEWIEVGRAALQSAEYVGGPVVLDGAKVLTPAHGFEAARGFRRNRPDSDRGFFVTANLFVRRSVFEDLGGFDERLSSGGDNEFGRRVGESGRYRQGFDDRLAVVHPPRGYHALVRKAVRLAEGKAALNRLYPARYQYARPGLLRLLWNAIAPPAPHRVLPSVGSNPNYGFAAFYLFMWRYRMAVARGLLDLFYGKGRTRLRADADIPATTVRVTAYDALAADAGNGAPLAAGVAPRLLT
jgi:glycosyltransferase AglI